MTSWLPGLQPPFVLRPPTTAMEPALRCPLSLRRQPSNPLAKDIYGCPMEIDSPTFPEVLAADCSHQTGAPCLSPMELDSPAPSLLYCPALYGDRCPENLDDGVTADLRRSG